MDRHGMIIKNGFIDGANRVEVTILPSDFSFNSEHCRHWQLVN